MQKNKDEELADLLARCAMGDQRALKQLYDKTSPFLNGVAYRILRSDDLSNEVLQEAFVQIWQNAGSYREHLAKPLTWMTSIVRYRALDLLQSEKRHRNREDYEQEEKVLSNLESNQAPESDYAHAQLQQQLHECLGKMNDNVRQSIELAYLKGYSREEIAEHFGTKVNTVKSWLHRGSERLKECLSNKIQTV
ncbi:MAG: sigma-70 family RNA polymerase sigma factor [Cellvibrionaceae bacterium]|nr:sigma-70 family RNA polymerase sigma factor [Cellvibrionaceae bacterium]